jgi:hypothetical protein
VEAVTVLHEYTPSEAAMEVTIPLRSAPNSMKVTTGLGAGGGKRPRVSSDDISRCGGRMVIILSTLKLGDCCLTVWRCGRVDGFRPVIHGRGVERRVLCRDCASHLTPQLLPVTWILPDPSCSAAAVVGIQQLPV